MPAPRYSFLTSVSAISASDIWAAGSWVRGSHPLVEHWNGQRWRWLLGPKVPPADAGADGVAAITANDVWITGEAGIGGQGNVLRTFVEHWNGKMLSLVPNPNPKPNADHYLSSISAASSRDVWIAGSQGNENSVSRTLAEHWNGRRWTIVPSPNP